MTSEPQNDLPQEKPKRQLVLSQFLQLSGIAQTGGHAKLLIQGEEISVNGEIDTRRKRKLSLGDTVQFEGTTYSVDPYL